MSISNALLNIPITLNTILNKAWLNRILDFFYFEFIVGIYFIIIWRGVYDLVETGANDLFKEAYPDDYVTASLLFCFTWSFSIYLLIT